jgi:3-deoxy-7-phosphoheptulonate synthase
MEAIEDRNLVELRPLPAPRELKARLPLTAAAAATVRTARSAIRDAIHGRDARLIVIAGPCSIHDPDAALEYAARLGALARELAGELVLVMRTYFEKPRTTVGWKGLVNDPHLDGSCDVVAGLEIARRLLLQINELGVPCASEVLDPFTPQFTADLLAWASIGARTSESQTHRELASGLSAPVGFKNATSGDLESARNAMVSAAHPHSFLGIDAEGRSAVVSTTGNPDRHLVLRGGGGRPNHGREDVARALALVRELGLARPVMVDCSHDNSAKDHTRQGAACREVMAQIRDGETGILGLLLESHLEAGRQSWSPRAALRRGVSITDACIGWDETEVLLREAAAANAAGRGAMPPRSRARPTRRLHRSAQSPGS